MMRNAKKLSRPPLANNIGSGLQVTAEIRPDNHVEVIDTDSGGVEAVLQRQAFVEVSNSIALQPG